MKYSCSYFNPIKMEAGNGCSYSDKKVLPPYDQFFIGLVDGVPAIRHAAAATGNLGWNPERNVCQSSSDAVRVQKDVYNQFCTTEASGNCPIRHELEAGATSVMAVLEKIKKEARSR